MKNPLYTGKLQAPQPPVQLLSCKEGKFIESETHMRRNTYDSRQEDRWSFRLYAHTTEERRKAHCSKSPSSLWPKFTFTCSVAYSSSARYVPARWHLSFPLALTTIHRLGGVIWSTDEETETLWVRWFVHGHWQVRVWAQTFWSLAWWGRNKKAETTVEPSQSVHRH